MNYATYEKSIVERYRVKLVGWTYDKFVNPSHIGTMTDICKLRDALKCGECHWVRLSQRELQDHREETGEIVAKQRRQRSDKGKTHKRKAATDENDQSQGLAKRARHGRAGVNAKVARGGPCSNAVIDSSSSEEED
jgi:hypothetical protein